MPSGHQTLHNLHEWQDLTTTNVWDKKPRTLHHSVTRGTHLRVLGLQRPPWLLQPITHPDRSTRYQIDPKAKQ